MPCSHCRMRTFTNAWVLASLVAGLWSCSSSSSTIPGTGAASGGASGNTGRGGAGTAGVSAGAGGSAVGVGQCRSIADCSATGIVTCVLPGETAISPTVGCTGPMCATGVEEAPVGDGLPCMTNSDCPSSTLGVGDAKLCSAGKCTECTTGSDCPAFAPLCVSDVAQFGVSFTHCVQCTQASDCPASTPRCVGTSCAECSVEADCAVGVCSQNQCVPGCSVQNPCRDPLLQCSDVEQRCVGIPCSASSPCPKNGTCNGGSCTRTACAADTDCSGFCVNQLCQDALGTCVTLMFPS
ncbi:MAG TPA: hypothetical protein VGI10_04220 [Polyangiaceae bacterium]|jgi:hypothetical protein